MPSNLSPKIQTYSEIKSKLLQPSLTSTYNVYFNAAQLLSLTDSITKASASEFLKNRGNGSFLIK